MVGISDSNVNAIGSADFIGLNYYSRWHVKGNLSKTSPFTFEKRKQDIQTDMPYSVYPEGFYKALHYINKINIPIIVTKIELLKIRMIEEKLLLIDIYMLYISQ
jgi:beta-glucosidase/6-phospho-beta-glucosidase/beta-galactosidase|tara:strand:+ start:760 stop:1071 length:312 start_codon:yes stop_codon:yes gene_type:complete